MDSTLVIAGIVIILVALTVYAFLSQTISEKRKQKERLLSALNQRARNFKTLINGFPAGYLSKDLTLLVYQCLADVTEQLSKLDNKNTGSVEELAHYRAQMEKLKRQQGEPAAVSLQTPQQVKEVKALLQDLNNFIGQQLKKGSINAQQFKVYEEQIRQMVVQSAADNYLLSARQAEAGLKARLAAHYYGLAIKLLNKENKGGKFSAQIGTLSEKLSQQEALVKEQEPEYAEATTAHEATDNKEWEQFSQPDDDWKKKTIYD